MTIRAGTSRNSLLTFRWYEIITSAGDGVPVTFFNEEKVTIKLTVCEHFPAIPAAMISLRPD